MNMIYETCIVILWTVPDFPGRFSCTSGMIFKVIGNDEVRFKLKLCDFKVETIWLPSSFPMHNENVVLLQILTNDGVCSLISLIKGQTHILFFQNKNPFLLAKFLRLYHPSRLFQLYSYGLVLLHVSRKILPSSFILSSSFIDSGTFATPPCLFPLSRLLERWE